jgi:hypothetical protein
MASMLLFSKEGRAASAQTDASGRSSSRSLLVTRQFIPEGFVYPSYAVFRDVLGLEIASAKNRICILARLFEDREIAGGLGLASRRALTALVRVEPRSTEANGSADPFMAGQTLRAFGLTPWENSLKKLKLSEPTVVAIDNRAWNISTDLSELRRSPVEVEPAPFTAREVCGWADAAAGAKAATR